MKGAQPRSRHHRLSVDEDGESRLPELTAEQALSLLEVLPDDAMTIVMSDHGARPMMGGLCFNDWLIQERYLTLADPVSAVTPMKEANVDWGRTVAWGDGGYYGRLFLNVKGREPQGILEPARYEEVRDELIAKLMGTMQAPVAALVRTLNDVPSKLVRALAAVRDAKEAAQAPA